MLEGVCGDDTDVGGADAMSPGSSQGALRPGWPHSNIFFDRALILGIEGEGRLDIGN